MDVIIRQAHPGPEATPYRRLEQKQGDAEAYQQQEGILWPVLVDDLDGTVHQVYGGLADPIYLLDSEGRVAYYNLWSHAPTLHEAIAALLRQGGRGVVLGEGVDRRPHILPSMTDGWRGLRRGLPQSFWDMETSAPGMASLTWLGYQLRPLLAPLTLRAKPLPTPVRAGLLLAAGTLLALGARRLVRGGEGPRGR